MTGRYNCILVNTVQFVIGKQCLLNWGSKLIIRVHTHMCSSGKTVLSSHTVHKQMEGRIWPLAQTQIRRYQELIKKKKAKKLVIIFKVVVTLWVGRKNDREQQTGGFQGINNILFLGMHFILICKIYTLYVFFVFCDFFFLLKIVKKSTSCSLSIPFLSY